MKSKIFSVSQALRFGLYTVIDNFIFIITICLLYFIAAVAGIFLVSVLFAVPFLAITQMVVHTGVETMRGSFSAIGMGSVFLLIIGFFFTWLSLGVIKVAFDLHDYQQSSVRSLFSIDLTTTYRAFIANILYYLLTTLGFCFFIFPGFYFSIKYGFISYILIDKRVGIFEAFRLSSEITKGVKGQLFGLLTMTGILGWLGAAFFGIGLIVTGPMTWLAYVYVYRKLSALPQPINHERF